MTKKYDGPHEIFRDYKKNCKIFVETGTYQGDSTAAALEMGYEKCYTVEYNLNFYEECVERFKENDKVVLYLGNSVENMKSFLPNINEKCLFWLDAHDSFGTGGGVPTYEELEIIKQHPIKNHTIVIDDIPLYFGDGKNLEKAIKEINPDYKIIRVTSNLFDPRFIDYIIVAYIE